MTGLHYRGLFFLAFLAAGTSAFGNPPGEGEVCTDLVLAQSEPAAEGSVPSVPIERLILGEPLPACPGGNQCQQGRLSAEGVPAADCARCQCAYGPGTGEAGQDTDTHLVNPTELPRPEELTGVEPGYRMLTASARRRYGTYDLISHIVRASEEYRQAQLRDFPDQVPVPLHIGDLSSRNGGRLDPHNSHRIGIDADIYLTQANGEPFISERRGHHVDWRRSLDAVAAMVTTSNGRINRIWLARTQKNEMCRAARESGRFESYREVLALITADDDHHNHFHVRIACPDDQRCDCGSSGRCNPRPDPTVRSPDRHGCPAP